MAQTSTTDPLTTGLDLTPPEAALASLTLMALGGGGAMRDTRAIIGALLGATPALHILSSATIDRTIIWVGEMLTASDGLDVLLDLICHHTGGPQQATIYALAADFVVRHGRITPEEMRLLDLFAEAFHLDRLTRAAIDTGARLRLAPL